jgi:hypothetical protein
VDECIHYIINGRHGKELYEDVLVQYVNDPNREIYLRNIKGYVRPYEILKQVFTDGFIKEREQKMKNDFRGATIGNLNIAEDGDITVQQAEKITVQQAENITVQQAEMINNTSGLSDENLGKLFETLKELVKNDRMDKAVRDELHETIAKVENSDKTKCWKHIQSFIGKTANLATLIQFGFNVAQFFR